MTPLKADLSGTATSGFRLKKAQPCHAEFGFVDIGIFTVLTNPSYAAVANDIHDRPRA
jgi:hypothetical protein